MSYRKTMEEICDKCRLEGAVSDADVLNVAAHLWNHTTAWTHIARQVGTTQANIRHFLRRSYTTRDPRSKYDYPLRELLWTGGFWTRACEMLGVTLEDFPPGIDMGEPVDNPQALRRVFTAMRRDRQWTQKDAAQRLGISRSTLQNWEHGQDWRDPSLEVAALQIVQEWRAEKQMRRPEKPRRAQYATVMPARAPELAQEGKTPYQVAAYPCPDKMPDSEAISSARRKAIDRGDIDLIRRIQAVEDGVTVWRGRAAEIVREWSCILDSLQDGNAAES